MNPDALGTTMRTLRRLTCAWVIACMPVHASPEPSTFVVIEISAPGLEAEEVEERVTTPLERQLRDVSSIHELRSVSRQHGAEIVARLQGPGVDAAVARIRSHVGVATARLGAQVSTVAVRVEASSRLFPPGELR